MSEPIKIHSLNGVMDDVMSIKIFVCDICNKNCGYCYNSFPRTGDMIDVDRLCKFIENLKHTTKLEKMRIELIGGEPTCHPDLVKLIERLHDDKTLFFMYSNLSQNEEYYIDLIRRFQIHFDFSWHGGIKDRRNFDFVRKAKNISEFIRLGKHETQINFSIMLEPENLKNSLYVYDIINRICQAEMVSLEGQKVRNPRTTLFDYSYEEGQIVDKLVGCQTKDECEIIYSDGSIRPMSFVDMDEKISVDYIGWKCSAGRNRLYIHSNGDIYPCQSIYESRTYYGDDGFMPVGTIYGEDFFLKDTICPCHKCQCEWFVEKRRQ